MGNGSAAPGCATGNRNAHWKQAAIWQASRGRDHANQHQETLVRVLDAAIQVPILAVLGPREQLFECSTVRVEFVSDDHLRLKF
jgi:hypothetical protein